MRHPREHWPGATSRSAGLLGHLSADAPYVSACGESGAQLGLDLVLDGFSPR